VLALVAGAGLWWLVLASGGWCWPLVAGAGRCTHRTALTGRARIFFRPTIAGRIKAARGGLYPAYVGGC